MEQYSVAIGANVRKGTRKSLTEGLFVQAWRFDWQRTEPMLLRDVVSRPQPGVGEVLIRVQAAGVTPTELVWYPTKHKRSGGVRNMPIPGHEFCGVVADVGGDVKDILLGQEIYGMSDWYVDGATADYCITQPEWISMKPRQLSFVEAASVPIGALTAWQGLLDRGRLQPGERVLVHGAAGAVGIFAVQIAKMRGAKIYATASSRNKDFLLQIGVDRVVDYQNDRFEDVLEPFDVIFDTVGGDTLRRSWSLLKMNGRLITIATQSEDALDERTQKSFFIVEPNKAQLAKIAQAIEIGKIKPIVDTIVPFEQADKAYTKAIKLKKGRGKVVITI